MEERERMLRQLHDHLDILSRMDQYPAEGIYEENFCQYAFCCMVQGFITDRLMQFYQVSFPQIPYPACLKRGLHQISYTEIYHEFTGLDLNDCLFAFENFGLNVTFLGVDMEDRELSLLNLPCPLRKLIRDRWIFHGKDICYIEMDMLVEIPGLPELFKKQEEGTLTATEQMLFQLCLQYIPDQTYAAGPVILLPEGFQSGFVHILLFCDQESPFTSICYLSRSVFLAVYALGILCGNTQERRIVYE